MDRRQRQVLAGVAAAVVVLAAVVAVLAVGGDGEESRDTAGATTTTDPPHSTTTLRLETSTTTTTNEPDTTTTAPAPGEPVDGTGAVLVPASGPPRPAGACRLLAEPGYEPECGQAGDLVWLVERSRATGGLRVTVFRPAGAGRVRPALAVVDDGPDGPVRFGDVTARATDVSGDGTDELVVGFRGQGSSAPLDLDVVDRAASVVVHRTLDQGQATAEAGRIDVWAAVYGDGDARCCPSSWRHEIIGWVDGAWRVVSTQDERRSAPPEGEF